jgi:glutamate carboxypeptidase
MDTVAGTHLLIERAHQARPTMSARLAELVTCESPSARLHHLRVCAEMIRPWLSAALRRPVEVVASQGRPHLLAAAEDSRVLVLGHFDTVWPVGTIEHWPFTVTDDIARGPGVFDMKAGLVQAIAALELLADPDHVSVLLTSDEETGSQTSRPLITEHALRSRAVLVCEPSADGAAVKIGRKGIANYTVRVRGRAAHAGLEPHRGVNAGIELAHQVIAVAALGRADTTVTPTVLSAGTTVNTVPELARCDVDVRSWSKVGLAAVDAAINALRPVNSSAQLTVTGGVERPLFEQEMAESLFAELQASARDLGLAPPAGVRSGGGSDGNITAAAGVATLDGLGAVGGHPHSRDEFVDITAMPRQTALLTALLTRLRTG